MFTMMLEAISSSKWYVVQFADSFIVSTVVWLLSQMFMQTSLSLISVNFVDLQFSPLVILD